MPILEDHLGVQLGIMRVCDLLAARSIDPYTARVMLYGLRLAQRTLERTAYPRIDHGTFFERVR